MMRKPRMSPSTRSCLQRIETLRASAANRALARVEFERADAFADTIATMIDAVKSSFRRPDEKPMRRRDAVESF